MIDKTILRQDDEPAAPGAGDTLVAAALPDIPGFTVERELAHGGMGAVYKAWQKFPRRPVAIKSILSEFRHDEYFRRRFLEEAEVLAQLSSQHIIKIYQTVQTDEGLYLVIQYAGDGDLRDKMQAAGGRLGDRRACDIISGIARALTEAHHELKHPIMHLDIKPENILFHGDWPMLSDFGIATILEAGANSAGTRVKGDPRYWAPEQAEGRPCAASDIFALGLVFHELLTGSRPERRVVFSPEDEQRLTRSLPRGLRKYGPVIAACLRQDPAQRPTARELVTRIQAVRDARTFWQRWRLPLFAALVLGNLVLNPLARERVGQLWVWAFPPPVYTVRFEVAPPQASLWINGREQVFREVELTRGSHDVAATARGFVGVYRLVRVTAAGSSQTFALESLQVATDSEYLAFAADFGRDNTLLDADWRDPTLRNMVSLQRMNQSGDATKPAFLQQLTALAAAGDAVAQTTLYYAAFEEMNVDGAPAEFVAGLVQAADSGYALATVLQALHVLNELVEAGQDFRQNPDAFLRVINLLEQARDQGMPETAARLKELLGLEPAALDDR